MAAGVADVHRPRHIRDIAHIYLSRMRDRAAVPRLSLIVTSERKELFPAFHVANLAVAFSRRRAHVHVFELSGLHPNVCFHFSHEPRTYLPDPGRAARVIRAFPGITVGFDPAAAPPEGGPASDGYGVRVNMVHLPPVRGREGTAAPPPPAGRDDYVWGLLLAGDETPGGETGGVFGACRPALSFMLRVQGAAPESLLAVASDRAAEFTDVGVVDGWRHALAERVPVVLRDPGGRLALSYLSVCENLLNRFASWSKSGHARRPPGACEGEAPERPRS